MFFSLTTPVLNGAQYLAQTIGSIRRQSHDAFEYTIVDGGSKDGSIEIAEKAAKEDARIRLIVQPDLGQYASIIAGFEGAKGDFFAWLNADDLYTPWALEAVAGYCIRYPQAQWLTGLPGCWDDDGVLRYVMNEAWRPRAFIRQGWFHKDLLGFIQQESVFFSKGLFESLSVDEHQAFMRARMAGDFILWKAFAQHAPLALLPTALGGFRRHGANRSIVGMEAYMAEVRAAGAVFLPEPLRSFSRLIFANLSRWRTAKVIAAEDS